MHKMDKLARYFPKVENSKSFSRKKLCQNKIGTFHLKHPVRKQISGAHWMTKTKDAILSEQPNPTTINV